jgi:hypothetical protein
MATFLISSCFPCLLALSGFYPFHHDFLVCFVVVVVAADAKICHVFARSFILPLLPFLTLSTPRTRLLSCMQMSKWQGKKNIFLHLSSMTLNFMDES